MVVLAGCVVVLTLRGRKLPTEAKGNAHASLRVATAHLTTFAFCRAHDNAPLGCAIWTGWRVALWF